MKRGQSGLFVALSLVVLAGVAVLFIGYPPAGRAGYDAAVGLDKIAEESGIPVDDYDHAFEPDSAIVAPGDTVQLRGVDSFAGFALPPDYTAHDGELVRIEVVPPPGWKGAVPKATQLVADGEEVKSVNVPVEPSVTPDGRPSFILQVHSDAQGKFNVQLPTGAGWPLGWYGMDAQGQEIGAIDSGNFFLYGCGDSRVQYSLGEECDVGPYAPADGCSKGCRYEVCGDGIVQPHNGETCDDWNTVSDDGCSNWCVEERCGDGTIQYSLGEECDDGNRIDDDYCSNNCVVGYCGDDNWQPNAGERCDDGNSIDGDGCNSHCQTEYCGDGVLQPLFGEECDDGNFDGEDFCADCKVQWCGDGKLQTHAFEECDDGNTQDGDGCTSICRIERPCAWDKTEKIIAVRRELRDGSCVYGQAAMGTEYFAELGLREGLAEWIWSGGPFKDVPPESYFAIARRLLEGADASLGSKITGRTNTLSLDCPSPCHLVVTESPAEYRTECRDEISPYGRGTPLEHANHWVEGFASSDVVFSCIQG